MGKQTMWILVILLLPGVLLFWTEEVLGAGFSPVYKQVLEKLESLKPTGTIEVNMGVEPERYEESFTVTEDTLQKLHKENLPEDILAKLEDLKGKELKTEEEITSALEGTIGKEQTAQYRSLISKYLDYQGIATYAYSDKFEMRFQLSEDSYIVLMHIAVLDEDSLGSTGGNITLLLPNRQSPDTRIKAGQVYSTLHHFNMDIVVGPPPGFEAINLFCSSEKLDLFEIDFAKDPYYVITPNDEERLQKLLDNLNQLEGREWSGSSLKLRIGESPPSSSGITRGIPPKFGALPPIGATGTTGKFFPPIGATGTTGKTDN